MGRLTDAQKKMIVADYIEIGSYAAVARKYHISDHTVKRAVEYDEEAAALCEQKKQQNAADMLAYMDSRKVQAMDIIDLYLLKLADPDKLENATIQQIATVIGILVDKFTLADKGTADADKVIIVDDIPDAPTIPVDQTEGNNAD